MSISWAPFTELKTRDTSIFFHLIWTTHWGMYFSVYGHLMIQQKKINWLRILYWNESNGFDVLDSMSKIELFCLCRNINDTVPILTHTMSVILVLYIHLMKKIFIFFSFKPVKREMKLYNGKIRRRFYWTSHDEW